MNAAASEYVTPPASPTINALKERLGFALDDDGTRAALVELAAYRNASTAMLRAEIDHASNAKAVVCRVCGATT